MQNTYNPKHTHNKQHKIWNSLYQFQNLLTSLIPVTFIGNKTHSNWKQLCRVHKQVSRRSWGWLSASSATGDMPGLYCSVYTARMVAVYSEVQMFADLAQCVILHTPYKKAIPLPMANVWSHISMSSSSHCSSPYILCHYHSVRVKCLKVMCSHIFVLAFIHLFTVC